jgi:hypothetical protein
MFFFFLNKYFFRSVLQIRDVHPGSRTQKQQKRGMKKNVLSYPGTFYVATKIVNYINFEQVKKKVWAYLQRIIEVLPKTVPVHLKYGFGIRYPRSGIRKKPILDAGSRGQKGTGSRIGIRNTAAG